jgi:virginiamycin A acetyltransferase
MYIYLRIFLWRILGFDYNILLSKTDYSLLKYDLFTLKGIGTYDNGAKVWRWSKAPIVIGKYCSIAHGVNFIVDEGYHKGSAITNYPFISNLRNFKSLEIVPPQKEGITIGNDVWIGIGSFIMPGVTVGNGVVIGANSVVTNDIPDFAIVGGSPARILKMKFNEEVIKKLNLIAWWNWDPSLIKERYKDFYIKEEVFISKYEN